MTCNSSPHSTDSPTGLEEVLLRVGRDYGDLPPCLTANGAAFPDHVVRLTARPLA